MTTFYELTRRDQGRWTEKLNSDELSISIQGSGSSLAKNWPVIVAEFFLSPKVKLFDLMTSIHNSEDRKCWDAQFEDGEILDVKQNQKVLLWYQANA